MDAERIKIGFGKFFKNQYMKVICISIMYAINGGHNLQICSIYNSHKKDEIPESKLAKNCVISSWRKL